MTRAATRGTIGFFQELPVELSERFSRHAKSTARSKKACLMEALNLYLAARGLPPPPEDHRDRRRRAR